MVGACSGTITVEHDQSSQGDTNADSSDHAGGTPSADADGVITFDDEDQPIEGFDGDITTGTLDNGLTYFIRPNTAPGGRAELRLAVNAGSLQEDDDQSGVAHFLEHMLFNGTEKYPANELVSVLESFGSEFGPDVNAYTSFDETVYQLSLPTDDDELFGQGLDVLYEWATNATISDEAVADEIGVVVEEWRLRAQGSAGRLNTLYDDLLLTDTAYEGRQPIGEIESLEAMTADKIRRFYNDWYRPELMAIVVVGDIKVGPVEDAIKARFGSLKNPNNPRQLRTANVTPITERGVGQLGDPDRPTAYVEATFAQPAYVLDTIGEARRSAGFRVASLIVDTRLADDLSLGAAPFFAAYNSSTPLARELAAPGLVAEAEPAKLAPAFKALSDELLRIRRDGFSEAEVARARATLVAQLDQREASAATTQDAQHASAIVNHFLGGGVLLTVEEQLALERRVLSDVTPAFAQQEYLAVIDAAEPRIAVVGDIADVDAFPSEDVLYGILDNADSSNVDARNLDADVPDTLMEAPPKPASADTERWDDLAATKAVFQNGVTVLVKETSIDENSFDLWAEIPGGTSALDEAQLAAASVAPSVVVSSGVGALDQPALDRVLSDKVVSLNVLPGETEASLSGYASSENQEVLFQMVNLYLSSPRATQPALEATVAQLMPFAEEPAQLPDVVANDALFDLRLGESPRFDSLPDPAALAEVTTADVLDVYDELYGNANSMVITVVGDVDTDRTIDLAGQYFGTLEDAGSPTPWVDHVRPPVPGRQEAEVQAGEDQQGRVSMLLSVEATTSQERELQLSIVEKVIATRLRDQLRERLGAAYAPFAAVESNVIPDETIDTYIQVDGDPEGLDVITDEIDALLDDLRNGGLTSAEVATAVEQVRRDSELVSNSYYVNLLYFQLENPDTRVLRVDERVEFVADTSTADIQQVIDLVLGDSVVVVKLRPRS